MARYEITAPDGNKYEITAPDDATEAQVMSYAQQNYQGGGAAPAPEAPQLQTKSNADIVGDNVPYTWNIAGLDTGKKMSPSVGRFLTGAGAGMASLARGAGQLVGLSSKEDEAVAREMDAPILDTTAGKVGKFVGQTATALPTMLIPGVNTYAGASLVGGGLGGLQPTVQGENKLGNVGLGAAGGIAGKYLGDKVVRVLGGKTPSQSANATGGTSEASVVSTGTPTATGTGGGYNYGFAGEDASAGLNSTLSDLAQRAKAAGFKLTPGQASGSKALQQLEVKLESQPMTSGPFNAIKANNIQKVNQAVAESIGEKSNVVDSGVLASAHNRLSRYFQSVADDVKRPINTDAVLGKLASVEDEFEGLTKVAENTLTKKFMGLLEKGEATGRQLADLSSKLGKAANQQMTSGAGDREAGKALYAIKDVADDLLQSGMSGKQAEGFALARTQYRNFINVAKSPGVVKESGNVSGPTLANVLARKDFHGFKLGKNTTPMYEAARFSQGFGPIVNDSGTATRSAMPSPTDFVLSLPFNLAARAYTSSPAVSLAQSLGGISRNGISPSTAGLLGPLLKRSSIPIGATGLLGITE